MTPIDVAEKWSRAAYALWTTHDTTEPNANTLNLKQMAAQEAGARMGMALFNPPPASEWGDSTSYAAPQDAPTRLPYELRRLMTGSQHQARLTRAGKRPERGQPDTRPIRYLRPCRRHNERRPCHEQIEVYRVVTGTIQGSDGVAHQEYVFYWPDTAIVIEVATEYASRPVQHGFCSWKCAALWTAKLARDTES